MHPFLHLAMVAIGILTFLPVGAIVCPSGSFIGSEKVASMTPVVTVHSPKPNAIGCAVIRKSGVPLNSPLLSVTCCLMPSCCSSLEKDHLHVRAMNLSKQLHVFPFTVGLTIELIESLQIRLNLIRFTFLCFRSLDRSREFE
jgi:hypothetical protein